MVRTSKSIITHPGRLRGFDVDELPIHFERITERVRMVLENRFNITLSEVGTSLHQPITRFYNQLGKKTYKIWNKQSYKT